MKNLWLVLLVCVAVAAAFFLGRQTRGDSPAPQPAPAVAAPGQPDADATRNALGETLSPEPVRTYRGPEGLPMLIAYGVDEVPDNGNANAVKAGVLSDMKHHPHNIETSYGLSRQDITDIVEGRKPFPALLLPKPAATAPAAR